MIFAVGLLGACSRTIVENPPALRLEVITEQPGPEYVWIGGYWGGDWGHYSWVSGHWARPPHAHAAWIAPRWEEHGGTHVFVEGSWR